MQAFLTTYYLWIKALHILAVIAWMAGMFYLPRLFVYHCETVPGAPDYDRFVTMERRLLKMIMNPAMGLVWVFGLTLAWLGHWWQSGWFDAKMVLVIAMTITHHLYARWTKDFAAAKNTHSPRFYKLWNEVPTLLLLGIVILVVVKPF